MRKTISILAVNALLNRKKLSRSNTKVVVLEDGTSEMYLWNNKIAIYKPNGDVYVSFAGWPTKTTQDRLSAFPSIIVWRGKGLVMFNGHVVYNTTSWVLYANIKTTAKEDYIVEYILKTIA